MKWAEHRLERFENSKYLQKKKVVPSQSAVCPIDFKEFAKFQDALFSFSFQSTPNDEDKYAIQQIQHFDWKSWRLHGKESQSYAELTRMILWWR